MGHSFLEILFEEMNLVCTNKVRCPSNLISVEVYGGNAVEDLNQQIQSHGRRIREASMRI